jgi:hypothetical protein
LVCLSIGSTARDAFEAAVAVAVTIGGALITAFVAGGADPAFHVGFHQHLYDGLGGAAQKVRITGFRQQLSQG